MPLFFVIRVTRMKEKEKEYREENLMKIFVEPKERLIILSQEEFELYNFLDKNKNKSFTLDDLVVKFNKNIDIIKKILLKLQIKDLVKKDNLNYYQRKATSEKIKIYK